VQNQRIVERSVLCPASRVTLPDETDVSSGHASLTTAATRLVRWADGSEDGVGGSKVERG
jgi:hypothetical protein